jgi:hypothetical protein
MTSSRHERLDTHDVHDGREIVSQHMECHLGGNPWQHLHQEVGCTHPGLDGAEGMLDRLAPLAHLFRMLVESPLNGFEKVFMLPSGDSPLLAGGAALLDGAAPAGVGRVAAQDLFVFFGREGVGEPLSRRTIVNILEDVAEVLLAEAPFRL